MNSAILAIGIIVLIVVVGLLLWFSTRTTSVTETETDTGLEDFDIGGLVVGYEKTNYQAETYVLRNIAALQKEVPENPGMDDLNKFIDFGLSWTNPNTNKLQNRVGYLRIKRTMKNEKYVFNYYIINQNEGALSDQKKNELLALPQREDNDENVITNIVYVPSSADYDAEKVDDSDKAAQSKNENSYFFTPGAPVRMKMFGADFPSGVNIVGTQKFELFYYTPERLERPATINGDAAIFESNVPEDIYLFDFKGVTQEGTVGYTIITESFNIEGGTTESSFARAGTVFNIAFKSILQGTESYKWIALEGESNIVVRNDFLNPKVCNFKVSYRPNNRVILSIDDTLYLTHELDESNNFITLATTDQGADKASSFMIEEALGVDNTYFIKKPIKNGDETDDYYLYYDQDANTIRGKLLTDLRKTPTDYDYAAITYYEEMNDWNEVATTLGGNLNVPNRINTGTNDYAGVDNQGIKPGDYDETLIPQGASSSEFIFENVPGVDGTYYIKTSEEIDQVFKTRTNNRIVKNHESQMYLISKQDGFHLIGDGEDFKEDRQKFNVYKTGENTFILVNPISNNFFQLDGTETDVYDDSLEFSL